MANTSNHNSGRSWSADRRQRNKSESWEKPMSQRKNSFDNGGGVDFISELEVGKFDEDSYGILNKNTGFFVDKYGTKEQMEALKRELDFQKEKFGKYSTFMPKVEFLSNGGGVDKRDSWHSDRRQFNKSEDWEKPMSQRKNRYDNGGGVDSEWIVKLQNEETGDIEDVNVMASSEDEAIEIALTESGYTKGYTVYSANEKYSNGGDVEVETKTVFLEHPLLIERSSDGTLHFDFDSNHKTGWSYDTEDIGEAVAIMMGSRYKENPKIREITITPKQLRLSDKKEIIYWLSGGNEAWRFGDEYKYDFNKTYNDLWKKEALKLKKAIQKFTTIGELMDFYKKEYLDYPYFLDNAMGYGYTDFDDDENEEMKNGGRIKSALMRDRAYKSQEPHEQAYSRTTYPKKPHYKKSESWFENGGGVGSDIIFVFAKNKEDRDSFFESITGLMPDHFIIKQGDLSVQLQVHPSDMGSIEQMAKTYNVEVISENRVEPSSANYGDVISINLAETALGRKINSWKDDVITIGSDKYKKVYLRPEYKRIN